MESQNLESARKPSKLFSALTLVNAFLGAFLLFLVQPLIAKIILPWFGGNQSVWILSMLFFQVALVAGYAYAFLISRYLSPKIAAGVHILFLSAALIFLPIIPGDFWKASASFNPGRSILGLLAATVGIPYLLLSSTSPLLQVWLARAGFAKPYRLYSLSNLASFLALLIFPLAIEIWLPGTGQAIGWSWIFVLFVLAFFATALMQTRLPKARLVNSPTSDSGHFFGWKKILLWISLSAVGSTLMLATTTAMSQDVASFPLLWILPLALYLVTFILAFDSPRRYPRIAYGVLFVFALFTWAMLSQTGSAAPLPFQVLVYSFLLFVGCMICHGELARQKPANEQLAGFYFWMSLGGALGGVFVGLIAPLVFSGNAEMQLSVLAVSLIAFYFIIWQNGELRKAPLWSGGKFIAVVSLLVFVIALYFNSSSLSNSRRVIYQTRGFYGILSVVDGGGGDSKNHYRSLFNGRINHGDQFIGTALSRKATTYYGEGSGVKLIIDSLSSRPNLRIGVVGLGTGTIAALGRTGDYLRFYELNSQVVEIAKKYFSYLSDSQAATDVVLGDARISLENEIAQQFDVLAVDAFSGDAIPAHLLTKEAMAVYLRHVKPDGVVAFHITNIHLDLRPVVYALAEEFGLEKTLITAKSDIPAHLYSNTWILLSKSGAVLENPAISAAAEKTDWKSLTPRLWTDDYSNLLQILKF